VMFLDSSTDEPIGFSNGTEVTVQITGRDSDKIVDLLNQPSTTFKSSNGFLTFALLDELTPDESNPLRFNIVATAPGYISTSMPVSIVEKEATPIEVYMVNGESLPEGITGGMDEEIGSATSEGRTSGNIEFGTQVEPNTRTSATFKISENTLITDVDGQPLSGELRSDYHLFNSRDVGALQSFPGGFSAEVENSPNGEEGVYFTTGGFASVVIRDENGNRARNFDPAIEVSIELDNQGTDHENNEVNAGDEVPIWSFNDEDGTWSFEGDAPISDGGNGNLEVTFDADHLSWWNIDWFGSRCFRGTRINLEGSSSQLRGKLMRADNGRFLGWASSRAIRGGSNFIQFLNAPQNVAGVLELYDMNNTNVATVDIPDMCSTSPINVELEAPNELTVTFRGKGICANNDEIEVRPSFPAYYRPLNGGRWVFAGSVLNGEIDVTLPGAGEYLIGAFFENSWYQFDLDLTSAQSGDVFEEIIELPNDVCNDL